MKKPVVLVNLQTFDYENLELQLCEGNIIMYMSKFLCILCDIVCMATIAYVVLCAW